MADTLKPITEFKEDRQPWEAVINSYHQASDIAAADYTNAISGLVMGDQAAGTFQTVDVIERSKSTDFSQNAQSVHNAMKEVYLPLDYPVEYLDSILSDTKVNFNTMKEGTSIEQFTGMTNTAAFEGDAEEARQATLMKGYVDACRNAANVPEEYRGTYMEVARAYYLADLVPDGGNVDKKTLGALARPIERYLETHQELTPDVEELENNTFIWKGMRANGRYDIKLDRAVNEGYSMDIQAVGESPAGFASHLKEMCEENGWDTMSLDDLGLDKEAAAEAVKNMDYQNIGFSLKSYTNAMMDAFEKAGANTDATNEIRERMDAISDVFEPDTTDLSDPYVSEAQSVGPPMPPPQAPIDMESGELSDVMRMMVNSNDPNYNQNYESVYNAMKETYIPLDYPSNLIAGIMNKEKPNVIDMDFKGDYSFTNMDNSEAFDNKYEARAAVLMKDYADVYRTSMGLPEEDRATYLGIAKAQYLADLVPNGGDVSQEMLDKLAGPIEEHVNNNPSMNTQTEALENNAYAWKSIYEKYDYDSMIKTATETMHEVDVDRIVDSPAGFVSHVYDVALTQGEDAAVINGDKRAFVQSTTDPKYLGSNPDANESEIMSPEAKLYIAENYHEYISDDGMRYGDFSIEMSGNADEAARFKETYDRYVSKFRDESAERRAEHQTAYREGFAKLMESGETKSVEQTDYSTIAPSQPSAATVPENKDVSATMPEVNGRGSEFDNMLPSESSNAAIDYGR